eukprot:scaffold46759_cov354-Isochrysis_galbana.AAC.1
MPRTSAPPTSSAPTASPRQAKATYWSTWVARWAMTTPKKHTGPGCNGVHVAESIKTPPPLYCTTSPKHNDGSLDKACSGWGRGAGLRARRHRPTSPSGGCGASGTVRLVSAAR